MINFSNILIAEDDFADYLFFAEALEKVCESCSLSHSKNGFEFMAFMKNEVKPDLIFLDLNMPGYNGLYCLKYLKDKEDFADIPVIVYSTSHYIKDIDACFKNGTHYYIVKPTSLNLLVQMLKQVITRLGESKEQPDKNNFVVRATPEADVENYPLNAMKRT